MIVAGLATERSTVVVFKGSHFERDIVLWGVRWYVAYPISYRQLEEMMEELGVEVDHSGLNRWMLKYAPLLDQAFRGFCRKYSQWTSGTEEVGLAYSTREWNCFAGRSSPVSSNWPFRIMCISSIPMSVTAADQKNLTTSIGRTNRLMAR